MLLIVLISKNQLCINSTHIDSEHSSNDQIYQGVSEFSEVIPIRIFKESQLFLQ